MSAESLYSGQALPIGGKGQDSTGWWGVWTLILTEASLFGYLLLSYFYLYAQPHTPWPPDGLPKLPMSSVNTAILIASSFWVWCGERALKRRRRGAALGWLALAIVFGAAFVGVQLNEWHAKPYGYNDNLYASLYFTVTGFHMLHVIVGLIVLLVLWLWTRLGYFDAERHAGLSIGGAYWHFVDAVWLFVFSSFYLFPYLAG